jgi:hypothetical protein
VAEEIKLSRGRKVLFFLITAFFSLLFILVLAEVFLRVVPIPGISYDIAKYDTLTGAGYYPNSVNFYRNDRGDFVKRKISKWGYYDKDYSPVKPDGVTRVGFFGDSYVEAVQVPLEETFHYQSEEGLKKNSVETLSFGVGGFSTFQSYLTYTRWADYFDLDAVVYVFFENDPGDQIKEIKKSNNIPYPLIENGQLVVDNSFRERRKNRTKPVYRFFDYLTSQYLVFATISERLTLLARYGVKIKVTEEDRYNWNTQIPENKIFYPPELTQGHPPSHWPDSIRRHAIELEAFVILKWKEEVEKSGREFAILYTPNDIRTPTFEQDSWKPWLQQFCLDNQIPFIDPSARLLEAENKGMEVFYDHYTRYGHKAVADEFVNWWINSR